MNHATHLTRTHHINLDAPPAEVFLLFTPAGEKLWIREWDPRFLHSASGETQQGMVFITGAGAGAGNAFLEPFSEETFSRMIDGWKALLEDCLGKRA